MTMKKILITLLLFIPFVLSAQKDFIRMRLINNEVVFEHGEQAVNVSGLSTDYLPKTNPTVNGLLTAPQIIVGNPGDADNLLITGIKLVDGTFAVMSGNDTVPPKRLATEDIDITTITVMLADSANGSGASGTYVSGKDHKTDMALKVAYSDYKSTNYYVSPTGNNGNNGLSSTEAWATLVYAASQVTTPGSLINLSAGTHAIDAQVALAPGVSLKGVGNTSIIDCNYVSGDFTNIRLASAAEGTDGNQSISYLRFVGDNTAFSAIEIKARSNVSVHHCEFYNFTRYGVYWTGRVTGQGEPTIYAKGNSFHHNIALDCGNDGIDVNGGLAIGGQEGMLIYDNTITQTAINATFGAYQAITYAGGGFYKGMRIYNNRLIVPPAWGVDKWDFALLLFDIRGGVEVFNNYIEGEIDVASLGVGCVDTANYGFTFKVYDNTIRQPVMNTYRETGIDLEREYRGGIYIYNNLFENLTFAIQNSTLTFYPPVYVEDIYIFNNIFNEVGVLGAGYPNAAINLQGNATSVLNNINILNNTFYGGTTATADPQAGIKLTCSGTNTNFNISNNIIRHFTNHGIDIVSGTYDRLSVENNLYYNNGTDYQSHASTLTNLTYQNNFNADPLFVTLGTDFSLQNTSPAINAGIDVGLTSDYLGRPIIGRPDIGAFETPKTTQTSVIYTIRKTIGWDGATLTDFKWIGNTDATAQNLDLGAIIPAKAKVLQIEIICTETLVAGGAIDITIRAGNASAGEQFIASLSCDVANEVVGIINPSLPQAVVMDWTAATHIWIGGDPDLNWDTMTAGKWDVYITYIQYQ